eukprot:s2676_g11.t1
MKCHVNVPPKLTACQDESVEMCRKQMQMRLELDEEHRQTRRLGRLNRTPRDERMQERKKLHLVVSNGRC